MSGRWLLAALAWLCGACSEQAPRLSVAFDEPLRQRLAEEHPAWQAACEREPGERIGLPLALNREPRLRAVPEDLFADLSRAVRELPQPFARLFERHVCAVVLVHAAPMTGTVGSLARDPAQGIIFLNVDNLSLSADAWLAFKESTAFQPAAGLEYRGRMSAPGDDPRAVLLEYLLVHELGHVLDHVQPEYELIDAFKQLSWPRRDRLSQTRLIHYPERVDAEPLPDAALEDYYDVIRSGAFTSPATVSNANEDFADSLASYVHTRLRGRPWQLDVLRGGQLAVRLESCWQEPRCAEKRGLLERMLREWADAGRS
jgi:hypothetical protein